MGKIQSRTQSSVALSGDGERWFLVNASPDLRAQIESFGALQPRSGVGRGSPIEAVLLTNADLDHVLGLLSLREGEPIAVLATRVVRETLATGLRLEDLLGAFGGVRWIETEAVETPLLDHVGAPSGLSYRTLDLPGGPPPYARFEDKVPTDARGHCVAFQVRDEITGGRLLVAPDLSGITAEFRAALAESDAVLIDGTFWSDDELRAVRPSARSAREMGHLPISDGTLELMQAASARYKAYVHINNTNPVLLPGSRERAAVEAAGVRIAEDGWGFAL